MNKLARLSLIFSGIAAIALLLGLITDNGSIWKPSAVICTVGFALGMGSIPGLRSFRYTAWIIVAVVVAMIFPGAFTHWGDFDLRNKWLILIVIQLVMFGMGIQMSLKDFTGIASTGKGVLIGLLCHFTVMPLMGLLLTKVFTFEPEIAAGIILVGSCSSGLASNVMTYIARGNLALSVVVTAMTTLFAPFLTPLLMKLLAGTLIEVKFVHMMMEIIKIVIVPIGAALLHNFLKTASPKEWRIIIIIAILSIAGLLAYALGLWNYFETAFAHSPLLETLEIFGFFLAAFLFGVAYHLAWTKIRNLDELMPYVSMFGIIYFTAVTTAAGRDNLMRVGWLLFMCSVIHNAAGFYFGYWLSRASGLGKTDSRTIAFEVGLQNGGMASGLAGSLGKLGTLGLPAAVFSPWMNIAGSLLANFWRRRPVKEDLQEVEKEN